MNSRLAARDVDGGAYCCTGKAHHLARRLPLNPKSEGTPAGRRRASALYAAFLQALRGPSTSGLITMPLQAADRVSMQPPRSRE